MTEINDEPHREVGTSRDRTVIVPELRLIADLRLWLRDEHGVVPDIAPADELLDELNQFEDPSPTR